MIKPKNIPKHVAIIMDGNGRWAEKQKMRRFRGHLKGIESIREIVKESVALGVKTLTLYSFSEENWNRPKEEVSFLMKLLKKFLIKEREELIKNNIRLFAIGNINRLPSFVQRVLFETEKLTQNYEKMNLILALSYSGREDILNAVKKIIKLGLGQEKINQEMFNGLLDTKGLTDPDLLIRTGGEKRISNFFLWQLAYTELYITDVLWPDFNKEEFFNAMFDFERRERRFGRI